MNPSCEKEKYKFKNMPYSGLGCFKELSSHIDQILKSKDDLTLEVKAKNLYWQIKNHEVEIIKYFLVTFFALKMDDYDMDRGYLKRFIENNLIYIKTIYEDSTNGCLTEIAFDYKQEKDELKILSNEINFLELEKTKICRQGQIQQAKNEIVRQQKYLHGLEQEYLVLKQEYEKLTASS